MAEYDPKSGPKYWRRMGFADLYRSADGMMGTPIERYGPPELTWLPTDLLVADMAASMALPVKPEELDALDIPR